LTGFICMIRVAIVEDDAIFARQLKDYLQRYARENGQEFSITCYTDGDEIVEEYTAELDIILMDIQMTFMNGMQAAEEIRRMDEEVSIIFVTGAPQFAIRGYKVGAMDYLVKPVEYYAFSQSMVRAIRRIPEKRERYITLNIHGGRVRVNVNNIRYIEVFDHNLVFHTLRGDYETKGTMSAMEEELAGESFYKSSKGCLVNLRYVDAVMGSTAVIGGDNLQISRARRKGMMDALNEYMENVGL